MLFVTISVQTCTADDLPRKLWKGMETSKIGGQIIQTVKYADDLVLLAKEQNVLQYMNDKLT